jgi:imidazolonepropionase-like amidohydrolase
VVGRIVLAIAVLLSAGPVAAKVTIYRGATLIDGTGAPVRAGMSIVVHGERIVRVAPDADIEAGAAEVVDAHGLYALPGLIDTHVHLATPPDLPRARAEMRRSLYAGVTAERDMADDLRTIGELAREALVGEIPGPDLYYAALMAGPSFFDDPRTIAVAAGKVPGHVPWLQAVDKDTDLDEAVTLARGTSASAIKIYANLPAEHVAAITGAAHAQGMKVWAHAAVFPALPSDVAAAGVDVMSHACYLGYEVTKNPPTTYKQPKAVDTAPFADGDNPVIGHLLRTM